MKYLTIWDFVLLPFYLLLIYFIASWIKNRHIEKSPEYKYYVWGLFAKIFGGIGVCLIYEFYYDGGDTTYYIKSSIALGNLLFKDPAGFFSILTGNLSLENWLLFDHTTGWPGYYHNEKSFTVIRFVSIFSILGFKSFILTTILIAWLTYSGIWRLFLLFYEQFPQLKKALAISILFIPSVVFWGSGILKDSFTLCAACWLIYSFYKIMKRENVIFYFITIIISSYVLISLKPYILYAAIVGILIMMAFASIKKIKGMFLRTILLPIIILIFWGLGSVIMMQVGNIVGGVYSSVDGLIEMAVVTQEDLARNYYGGNVFNIG